MKALVLLILSTICLGFARAEEKILATSTHSINSESEYRKMLQDSFPGLEFGFYNFSGRMMIGVLEDFGHDRILFLLRPDLVAGSKFLRNGHEFTLTERHAAKVKVAETTIPADSPPGTEHPAFAEEVVGYWIPLEVTDTFKMTLEFRVPDQGRLEATYNPDNRWQVTSQALDGTKQGAKVVPADAYEISRRPLLARVRQVLEEKPECVVRTKWRGDVKVTRLPGQPWKRDIDPLQVRLADGIILGAGEGRRAVSLPELESNFSMYSSACLSARSAPYLLVIVSDGTPDETFREIMRLAARLLAPVILSVEHYVRFGGTRIYMMDELDRLEKLKIPTIEISNQPLPAAIATLQKHFAGDHAAGVINFIIKGTTTPPSKSPSGPADALKEQTVSLAAKEINFAAAIDALCVQAGYEWWIDSEEGKALLVIGPRRQPLSDKAPIEEKSQGTK